NAAVGYRNHKVGIDQSFAGQFHADLAARFIHRTIVEDRIRAAEINVFEDAGAGGYVAKWPVRSDGAVKIDFHQFARLDLTLKLRADHVQSYRLASEHHCVTQPAHHQRTNAQRIAAGGYSARGSNDQGISPLDQPERVDKAIQHRFEAARGDEMDDDFRV